MVCLAPASPLVESTLKRPALAAAGSTSPKVSEEQRHPARPVVSPLGIHHLIIIDTEIGRDLGQVFGRDRAAPDQWRRCETEPVSVAANSYQACSALLDELVGIVRHPACLEPGIGRAKRGV